MDDYADIVAGARKDAEKRLVQMKREIKEMEARLRQAESGQAVQAGLVIGRAGLDFDKEETHAPG